MQEKSQKKNHWKQFLSSSDDEASTGLTMSLMNKSSPNLSKVAKVPIRKNMQHLRAWTRFQPQIRRNATTKAQEVQKSTSNKEEKANIDAARRNKTLCQQWLQITAIQNYQQGEPLT
jgi:hypothetical protein